ncbi:MAG: hypothetical protein SGBAC_011507, partial [Bacillariaceae sp.]
IGKQLRAMDAEEHGNTLLRGHLLSRIVSTEIGVRPAEPCSVSIAATHQLLTNLFQYIGVVILSDPTFCRISGAIITEQEVQMLGRCNHLNAEAPADITGASTGFPLSEGTTETQTQIHSTGDLWAEHILEIARAYIMTIFYVLVTMTAGFRLLDAALYIWLPQINIVLLRLIQGRNLRHRMVGRTVCYWRHSNCPICRSVPEQVRRVAFKVLVGLARASRVESFFSNIVFGLLGYRMDRTHSIMRIVTTVSPVSGADVRHRMEHMRLVKKVNRSLDVISSAYLRYCQDKHEKEA